MTTPHLLLLLPLLALAGAAVVGNIGIDNGLDRGDWGPLEFCPAGSYAYSFEIKYSGLGFVDDTCVNAIRLYCEDETGALTGSTLSTEGEFGQWRGMRTCATGQFLTGMRANVVPPQGSFGDDLGMDNLQMKCSDSVILDGLYGSSHSSNSDAKSPVVARDMREVDGYEMEVVIAKLVVSASAREYGEWGSWASCSQGHRICGHQSRVERESTVTDDAGLVDVIMYCCNTD